MSIAIPKAPTAVVRLDVEPDSVHLRVIDYGCGIPPEKLLFRPESPTIGIGLLGMRERLHQLGGQVEITSDGDGTTVHVIIPLREAA